MQNLYKYSKSTDKEFLYRLLYVAVTRASKDMAIILDKMISDLKDVVDSY